MAIQVDKNQAAAVQRSTRGSGDENTAKKCKNHNEMSWAEKYASNIKDTRSNSQVRFKKGSPHTVFELQRERERITLKIYFKKTKRKLSSLKEIRLVFSFFIITCVCAHVCARCVSEGLRACHSAPAEVRTQCVEPVLFFHLYRVTGIKLRWPGA